MELFVLDLELDFVLAFELELDEESSEPVVDSLLREVTFLACGSLKL